jgi:photolyase PhrII
MLQFCPQNLPIHLHERIRRLSDHPVRDAGKLVLYWMHHAVRGHENPALDTALHVADMLGLPLLVYQGLAGNHRFNADRHHAFILEGAQDAHAEMAGRGVRAVFHLPTEPHAASPLPELAAHAALVIAEDFPAPPFPAWTRRLAERIQTPVWAVDCACIMPMQLQPKRFNRAFELRRQNQQAYAERIPRSWPETDHRPLAYEGTLPFAPLDLRFADIPALCANCNIDHTLPPAAHTRGGSSAGYARWETFKRDGLASYHRLRNDAAESWPRGVSRLSAYLHHGHVSAFRIAREAHAADGEGAEKFLDELLIWRELAHNFCFFTDDPEAWSALPDWARDTLSAHAGDAREQYIDHERLARGATGDRLWDLAQRSLLVHGELHNNLRMTWAKAIAGWTRDPQHALAELIDLNHRHALDGSDPNSYGGLLWALGLFDRPFKPERPVTGTLRQRNTADHARRLDLDTYARRVTRPASGRRLSIAVVGAGMSGLAAARALSDQNQQVTLFEKSHGYGGRVATRHFARSGYTDQNADHGAQYFTIRDPRFRRRVLSWSERGLVARWPGRIDVADGQRILPTDREQERWVGVPGMNALGGMLAADLNVKLQTNVAPPRRDAGGWLLHDEQHNPLGHFDRVLIAAPAPQAARMLVSAQDLANQAATIRYAPCWAVMVAFDSALDLGWEGLFVNQGPLRWIANNSSKPGRSGHVFVLHAHADWTQQHLETDKEAVIAALLAAFAAMIGQPLPKVVWSESHRWLYSLADNLLAKDCLWAPSLGIGACGDWCGGARVEGAWLSGEALAGRVLAGC